MFLSFTNILSLAEKLVSVCGGGVGVRVHGYKCGGVDVWVMLIKGSRRVYQKLELVIETVARSAVN